MDAKGVVIIGAIIVLVVGCIWYFGIRPEQTASSAPTPPAATTPAAAPQATPPAMPAEPPAKP